MEEQALQTFWIRTIIQALRFNVRIVPRLDKITACVMVTITAISIILLQYKYYHSSEKPSQLYKIKAYRIISKAHLEKPILPLVCSQPSGINATMKQSSRLGFDRRVSGAPEIDIKCIQDYLLEYLNHCEAGMIPQTSNLVEYRMSGVISTMESTCLCPCVPHDLSECRCIVL